MPSFLLTQASWSSVSFSVSNSFGRTSKTFLILSYFSLQINHAKICHQSSLFLSLNLHSSVLVHQHLPLISLQCSGKERVHILVGHVSRALSGSLTGILIFVPCVVTVYLLILHPTRLGIPYEQRPHLIPLLCICRTSDCLAHERYLIYMYVEWKNEWVNQSASQWVSQSVNEFFFFKNDTETLAIQKLWETDCSLQGSVSPSGASQSPSVKCLVLWNDLEKRVIKQWASGVMGT